MDLRKMKGIKICQTKQIKPIEGGWLVPSQNSQKNYFVEKKSYTCTCPDCQTRGLTCKHAYAVQYFLQKITIKDGKTTIEAKRLSYPQAWACYDKSQQEEKSRFMELLKDLLESVAEPDYEFGRPKTSRKDLLFASALKVYSQFSLRRFMSDLKFAQEKGFVEQKPCFASVGHFMQKPELTIVLKDLIRQSSAPLNAVESKFAVDSSGFRTTKFNDYCREKHGEKKTHKWIKCHICTGTKTNIITGAEITDENGSDSPQFAPLVKATARNGFDVEEVSADKAYSSRENHEIVGKLGGTAYIPFRVNASGNARGSLLWHKMFHYFQYNQQEFLEHYHQRSNVESSFQMIKSKFSDMLKSKTKTAQENELLLKILCHNIVVVAHEANETGINTKF